MKQNIDQIKTKVIPILKQAGVTRSSLFGSVARGEAKDDSDIDILVDLPKEKDLLEFVHLKHSLENVLGRKVDLVEYHTIKPLIRDSILHDQIQII